MTSLLRRTFLTSSLWAILAAGCSVQESAPTKVGGSPKPPVNSEAPVEPAVKLSGEVLADGSSTVFPITQAVAEEFMKVHQGVKVSVGIAGTGGGFKRFVVGETDINDASRPISEKEVDACKKSGVEYLELKVAIDGLSVVVNPKNDWCKAITVSQLKKLWNKGSTVKKWNELDPSWPDAEIRLYGPGPDSGTFDYFTEAVNGKAKESRSDYTPSEDDNVLVQGVNGDKNSLGYFGYAYYSDNQDKVKLVAIADGDDVSTAVLPSDETILNGTYKPLSRPLFIYVNKKSFEKPQVREFVKYYIAKGQDYVKEVQYIQLPENDLKEAQQRLTEALSAK
ncbi:MAG: PstS family phosphate ABC transporter substrate-binding protein [Planctomycetota bacterium]|nr:MAG: PstS family phosphate ABC transporter substrate-binding protein [Planctomycetota bacterium]